jgi:hypothetical protein
MVVLLNPIMAQDIGNLRGASGIWCIWTTIHGKDEIRLVCRGVLISTSREGGESWEGGKGR